jgi:hypothetical protein
MPNVLIISMHFPPSAASGSFRILGFCRHLPKFNWHPTIVACPVVPREPVDDQLQSLIPAHTAVQYVPYPQGRISRLSANLLYRAGPIDRHLPWSFAALQTCRRVIQQQHPAAILTSGPPHSTHLLGLKLKEEFNLPLIADFRDPWITGHSSPPRLTKFLEQSVFDRADQIIANAPNALKSLQVAFPHLSHKMSAITNGFDLEETAPSPTTSGPIQILHTGELYAGRNPTPFLAALRAAEQSAPHLRWQVTFVGRATESSIDTQNCTSPVIVEIQIPYLAAKEKMRSADILLLLDSPRRLIGVPAKLYEYIGANRPLLVLAEPDSDTAQVARQCGVPHQIASPTNIPEIHQALLKLAASIQTQTPNQLAQSPYTRESITQKLAQVLDQTQSQTLRLSA